MRGKPLAGTEVAFAAVDEGLLALRGNDSWQLLQAMMQERAWGVETSTAQGEIIGRRHYGKKAVAAGGGGGRGATRELFDTLLVWKPSVVLDAERRGDDRGAAQRFADQLSPRRRRRCRGRQVRQRQRQHPRHAGPAGARRPAAAGARRRSLPGAADAAQHDRARDEGPRQPAGHGRPAGRRRDRTRADRAAARRTSSSPRARRRKSSGRSTCRPTPSSIIWDAAADDSERQGSAQGDAAGRRPPCRCACCRRRWPSSTAGTRCRSRRRPMRCPKSAPSAAASTSPCSRSSPARCLESVASSRPIRSSASSRRRRSRSA